MKLSDYEFSLPEELIAQSPVEKREESRLFVYRKQEDKTEDCFFYELERLLKPGDTIVVNDSKVIQARLWGRKVKTGGITEFFWLEEVSKGIWKGLMRGRNKAGAEIEFGNGMLRGKVILKDKDGTTILALDPKVEPYDFMARYGKTPLPPYIKRHRGQEDSIDRERYQTVYASNKGSVAAPTAGLHFSESMINRLRDRGVNFAFVTLHVGLGTFKPLNEEILEKKRLHQECYEISEKSAEQINQTMTRKNRIFVVGTTVARTLESAVDERGIVKAGMGLTDLLIYPGCSFKIVRNLITNFHLPKSSLLMLVSALIGRDKMMSIYQEAISKKYRFYSYGDAMLILG